MYHSVDLHICTWYQRTSEFLWPCRALVMDACYATSAPHVGLRAVGHSACNGCQGNYVASGATAPEQMWMSRHLV